MHEYKNYQKSFFTRYNSTIKKINSSKNNVQKNGERKFIEDEFKPETERRLKKQGVKMKSKTEELW